MVRPLEPRIEPSDVLREALQMFDEGEGADLSVRALARRLGVQSSSLYHHFKEKGEILDGVCRLVLSSIRPPDGKQDWETLTLAYCCRYREALLKHPNVIPLMQIRQPLSFGMAQYEYTLVEMARHGFTDAEILSLGSTLEAISFGSAALASRTINLSPEDVPPAFPKLKGALGSKMRADLDNEMFVASCKAIIEQFKERVAARKKRRAGGQPAKRAPAKKSAR